MTKPLCPTHGVTPEEGCCKDPVPEQLELFDPEEWIVEWPIEPEDVE